ncbi:unnamed protein product [Caenorhabditis angaria]|uniref:Uncharacterized protein n=1 Tax=Caenorhabditis angaria TaxID=860376 RepID=A0A9P1N9X3_9PELO|nr:unnamed protein product [Caenorhabditis angaria]
MPCVPKPQQNTRNASFNPSNAQYACCFQQLHANTGATIIAVLHIFLCLTIYPILVYYLTYHPQKTSETSINDTTPTNSSDNLNTEMTKFELWAECFLTTLCLITSIMLIVGLRLENRQILTGYILAQTLLISLLFVLFLALIMGIKHGLLHDSNGDKKISLHEELLIVLEIFVTLAIVTIEVWFLTVVLKTYRYICDKYNFTGGNREENV